MNYCGKISDKINKTFKQHHINITYQINNPAQKRKKKMNIKMIK